MSVPTEQEWLDRIAKEGHLTVSRRPGDVVLKDNKEIQSLLKAGKIYKKRITISVRHAWTELHLTK